MEEDSIQIERAGLKQVQLAAVREILRATTAALPLQDILPLIANVTIIAFDALTAWLMLQEDESLHTVIVRGKGVAQLANTTTDLTGGVIGVAANSNQPTILSSQSIDPADPVLGFLAAQAEPVVLLPVQAAGQVRGLLGAVVTIEATKDISFLVTLAEQAAIAIEDARLRSEARTWRQRLDAVVEQMNDPVMVYDQQGTLLLLNATAEQWLTGRGVQVGDTLADVVQKTGLCHADDTLLEWDEMAGVRALSGEIVDNLELKITLLPDQSTRYILANAVPLRTNGTIDGTVVVWHDITARKQMENALRTSEARYRRLVQTAAEGIWIIDQENRITYVNQQMAEMLGYDEVELQGWLFSDFIYPEDLDGVGIHVAEWQQKTTRQSECRLRRRDNSLIWTQSSTSVIVDDDGQFIGMLSMFANITSRKEAEQERIQLLDREQAAIERLSRLQAVTAALARALTPQQVVAAIIEKGISLFGAQAGVIAWLKEDTYTLEIVSSFGYTQDIIDTWRQFPVDTQIPTAEVVRTQQAIWLESGANFVRRYPALASINVRMPIGAFVALPLLRNDVSIGSLGVHFAAPRTFDAQDRAFLTSLADLCAQALERAWLYTAEQQARAAAQDALRIRDAFLSIASHELKTPLTVVLGQAQLLQNRAMREGMLNDRDQRALTAIIEQASQLNKLITAMLDVSQIERKQLAIMRTSLDIAALARHLVTNMQLTLEHHTLVYHIPDTPIMVEGDAMRLEQVINNLLSNAIKYSPYGGSITVDMVQRDTTVCIAIRDQGIGIPADDLPELFQRFYRADNAIEFCIRGTGIGLYVVKELVTLHGGSISVESTEGQGSTFTVCLPCNGSAPQ